MTVIFILIVFAVPTAMALLPWGSTVIAAQLFFHMKHRLIGALIGIRRVAFRAQRDLGVEMQRAFSAKAGTFAFERRVAGITAVEIFGQRAGNARLDAPSQCFANVEIFPGNAKRQSCLRGKTHPVQLS